MNDIDKLYWPHGATEQACSSCGLTMGETRLLTALKRGEVVIAQQVAPEPMAWASKRKMIERAIIGLRDGWATRKDADDALSALDPTPAAPAAAPASAGDLTMSMFATRQDFDDAIKGTAHTCGLAGEHFGLCPHCRAPASRLGAAPLNLETRKAIQADVIDRFGVDLTEILAQQGGKFVCTACGTSASHAANAGEDTQRLDFMIEEGCYIDTMAAQGRHVYRLYWPHSVEQQKEWFKSPREAIDAAIAASAKGLKA